MLLLKRCPVLRWRSSLLLAFYLLGRCLENEITLVFFCLFFLASSLSFSQSLKNDFRFVNSVSGLNLPSYPITVTGSAPVLDFVSSAISRRDIQVSSQNSSGSRTFLFPALYYSFDGSFSPGEGDYVFVPAYIDVGVMGTGTLSSNFLTGYVSIAFTQYALFSISHGWAVIQSGGGVNDYHVTIFYSTSSNYIQSNFPFSFDEGSSVLFVGAYPQNFRTAQLKIDWLKDDPSELPDVSSLTVCDLIYRMILPRNYINAPPDGYRYYFHNLFRSSINRNTTPDPFSASRDVFNILFQDPTSAYTGYLSYDYDGGGEIDLREWANRRNRFDPLDDVTTCGQNTVVDPENESDPDPITSSVVEYGPETRGYLRDLQDNIIGSGVPDSPSINSVSTPALSGGQVPSFSTVFNDLQSEVSSKLSSQGQYQAIRALLQPLNTTTAPVFTLPSSSFTLPSLGGNFQGDFGTENYSIDFSVLVTDSRFSVWFSLIRSICSFVIVLFTAWKIYQMYASIFGVPVSDEASNTGDDGDD